MPPGRLAAVALIALAAPLTERPVPTERVLLVGDSITAAWPAGLCRGAINMDVPSATTRDLLRRAEKIAAEKPDVIVVMAGVNDIAKDIPPNETAANVRALSGLAPRAVVHFVLPVTEDYPRPGYPERIAQINAAIGEAVPVKVSRRHYLGDGIHLRPEAYLVWRDTLRGLGVCE